MINYYLQFLPAIDTTIAHLHASVKSKPKDLKLDAFKKLQSAAKIMTYLLLILLLTSDIIIGSVLEQVVNVSPRPLFFFSRKLSKIGSGYSIFNHKLPVVHLAVCQFHHLLEGIRRLDLQRRWTVDHLVAVHAALISSSIKIPHLFSSIIYSISFTTEQMAHGCLRRV
ncbi:uncharacterized protein [Palaemon carinicauda]|uniref:uncharacterized protein n=1 Tax=Palaemon carinicauda TaxID=392227 RepID=UPI0035B5FAFB